MARYRESFKVEPELMGLVIGAGGSNIKKAHQIPGIIYIKNNKDGTFQLCGETAEAVQKARGMLEFKSEKFIVPEKFAGKIIGKYGKNIENIISKSLVHRIFRQQGDEDVSLEIIGTIDTIENAKLLLNYQLDELKAMEDSTPNLIPPTTNQNVIDCSSDKPQLEVGAELYNIHINRQTGISLGISITTEKEISNRGGTKHKIGKRWRGVKGGTVRRGRDVNSRTQEPSMTCVGNKISDITDDVTYYTRLTNNPTSKMSFKGGTNNSETQKHVVESTSRNSIEDETISSHSLKCEGQQRIHVKDRNTRGRIRKGELRLPSPDIIVEPPTKCCSNSKVEMDLDDPVETNAQKKKKNFQRGTSAKFKEFLEGEMKPEHDFTVKSDTCNKETIGGAGSHSKRTRTRQERRINDEKAFGECCNSDSDKPDFNKEQDENIPISMDKQQVPVTETHLTESFAKFHSLLKDEPIETIEMKEQREKEALDRIDELEVLKLLVQTFAGGCSFGTFICKAYSLFPGVKSVDDWFSTRSKRFHIYRSEVSIVYIAPFFRELNICKHYFNTSKLSKCDKPNCNYFHICRSFVRGNCRRRYCNLPHELNSPENIKLKENHGLKDFNDKDIIVLLNWKFPRLCLDYIYKKEGCPDVGSKEEECPYLHYCKDFFFGKCKKDQCQFSHSFYDRHNTWVLRSCHFSNQSDEMLKKAIYVPHTTGKHENSKGEESLVDGECSQEIKSVKKSISHGMMFDTLKYSILKDLGTHLSLDQKSFETSVLSSALSQETSIYASNKTLAHKTFIGSAFSSLEHGHQEGINRLMGLEDESAKKTVYDSPTKDKTENSKVSTEEKNKSIQDAECFQQIQFENKTMMFDPPKYSNLIEVGTNRSSDQSSFENGGLSSTVSQGASVSASNDTLAQKTFYTIPKLRHGHQESKDILIGSEDMQKVDECLLSDAAATKFICVSLTKRQCSSPTCQDLHLQNGVPFLWQIKLNQMWTSFPSMHNFQIEHAYCLLDDKIIIKDVELFDDRIYYIEVNFMQRDQDMHAILKGDTMSINSTRAIIRRLSTASFGDQSLNVDSYLTQWRWYWRDDGGAWLMYDSELLIYTLEAKFLKKQKTYLFFRDNYKMKYSLSFNDMEQTNLKYLKRRAVLRRPLFVSKNYLQLKRHPKRIISTAIEIFGEESKPSYFHPWDLANEFELVELDETEGNEYTQVLESFWKTMRQHGQYVVKHIYRVQSRKLWLEYQTKKKHMQADAENDKLSKNAIDEKNLFHGTDTIDICRGICINNFDFRKSGKNATVYGHGSYFARDATYSHSYTKPSSSGDRYMFRAKVLVGKFTQGNGEYRRPPEISGQSHKLYDSCVDDPVNPSIFVIFDRNQCYPEYLINYIDDMKERTSSTHGSLPRSTYYQRNSFGSLTQSNMNTSTTQNSRISSSVHQPTPPTPSAMISSPFMHQQSSFSSSSSVSAQDKECTII